MNNTVNLQLVQPAGILYPTLRTTDTFLPRMPITAPVLPLWVSLLSRVFSKKRKNILEKM